MLQHVKRSAQKKNVPKGNVKTRRVKNAGPKNVPELPVIQRIKNAKQNVKPLRLPHTNK